MATILPEGEAVRNAIKWVSSELQEHPDKSLKDLVNAAVTQFDLSPKDAEFLIRFYRESKEGSGDAW